MEKTSIEIKLKCTVFILTLCGWSGLESPQVSSVVIKSNRPLLTNYKFWLLYGCIRIKIKDNFLFLLWNYILIVHNGGETEVIFTDILLSSGWWRTLNFLFYSIGGVPTLAESIIQIQIQISNLDLNCYWFYDWSIFFPT